MNSRRGARHSGRRARYLGGELPWSPPARPSSPSPAARRPSAPNCSGKLTLDKHGDAGQYGVDYTFGCKVPRSKTTRQTFRRSASLRRGGSTTSGLTRTVIQPDGEVSSGDAFNCEGPIPGPGFGCPGTMTAGNHVSGQFATIGSPCRHQERRGAGNVVVPRCRPGSRSRSRTTRTTSTPTHRLRITRASRPPTTSASPRAVRRTRGRGLTAVTTGRITGHTGGTSERPGPLNPCPTPIPRSES